MLTHSVKLCCDVIDHNTLPWQMNWIDWHTSQSIFLEYINCLFTENN